MEFLVLKASLYFIWPFNFFDLSINFLNLSQNCQNAQKIIASYWDLVINITIWSKASPILYFATRCFFTKMLMVKLHPILSRSLLVKEYLFKIKFQWSRCVILIIIYKPFPNTMNHYRKVSNGGALRITMLMFENCQYFYTFCTFVYS